VGWQLPDKAHRVGQQEGQVLDGHFPYRGVERGEEFVLREHFALAEQRH